MSNQVGSISEASPDVALASLLACPYCRGPLEASETGDWSCREHGMAARTTLGVVDFLAGERVLDGAAGARFDLVADAEVAAQLAKRAAELTLMELIALKEQLLAPTGEPLTPAMRRARERFDRRYHAVEADVVSRGEGGITHKVNPYLESIGHPPLGGRWALEAGGGHGHYLVDFSRLYEHVLLVDCSLTLIVVAQRNAEEQGLENVHFVRGDATALPLASGSMDLVHENGVIEHVADPQALVNEGLRVVSDRGVYVILSPNRYPVTPEPHFRIPLFGAVPRPVRRWLLPRVRGVRSEEGTDLRSLRQLRGYLRTAGERGAPIYFLPRRLDYTVRQTAIRRSVQRVLASRLAGGVVDWLLNRVLLPVMPNHIVVIARGRQR